MKIYNDGGELISQTRDTPYSLNLIPGGSEVLADIRAYYFGISKVVKIHSFPEGSFSRTGSLEPINGDMWRYICIKFKNDDLENPVILNDMMVQQNFFRDTEDADIFCLQISAERRLTDSYGRFPGAPPNAVNGIRVIYYKKDNQPYIFVFLDNALIPNLITSPNSQRDPLTRPSDGDRDTQVNPGVNPVPAVTYGFGGGNSAGVKIPKTRG